MPTTLHVLGPILMNGGPISLGAVLAHDGRRLLHPSDYQIKVLSSQTGELIGALDGHADSVTCIALNPKQPGQVYSASKDGTLKLWDHLAGECIKTLAVRETVWDMVFNSDATIAYLSIDWRGGAAGRVIAFDLDRGKAGGTAMKTSGPRPLVVCCSGGVGSGIRGGGGGGGRAAKTFVATFDKHSLFVWRAGEEVYQPLNLRHTKPYTCAAISSDESAIAAGDASGRIQIWRQFGPHVPALRRDALTGAGKHHADPAVLRPTTLHWHASAGGCVGFSVDGTYLVSGGREGVLVLWRVEDGGQSFLPRLGGPLVSIQPLPMDGSRYLVAQADNMLRIINAATMKVDSTILGLRPLPSGLPLGQAAAATALQPGTGYLAVPCENAELQLFDTLGHRHVSLFKTINRNFVAIPDRSTVAPRGSTFTVPGSSLAPQGSQGGTGTSQPFVSHVAFSHSGASLITVDVRPGAGVYGATESSLKFWDLANATTRTGLLAPFALNTLVEQPHGGEACVGAVCTHPLDDGMAVTTGVGGDEGGAFRVWVRAAVMRKPGGLAANPSCWRCRFTAGYKDLPMTAAAFSPDGSVLAVAAGDKITLWDPETCRLARVFPPAVAGPPHVFYFVAFVTNSRYLVGASGGCVAVWDVLTADLHWSMDVATSSAAADPRHGSFAVAVALPEQQELDQRQEQQQQEKQEEQQPGGGGGSSGAGADTATAAGAASEQQGEKEARSASRAADSMALEQQVAGSRAPDAQQLQANGCEANGDGMAAQRGRRRRPRGSVSEADEQQPQPVVSGTSGRTTRSSAAAAAAAAATAGTATSAAAAHAEAPAGLSAGPGCSLPGSVERPAAEAGAVQPASGSADATAAAGIGEAGPASGGSVDAAAEAGGGQAAGPSAALASEAAAAAASSGGPGSHPAPAAASAFYRLAASSHQRAGGGAQRSSGGGGPSTHILVFSPESPVPMFHCEGPPGARHPILLYVPPGMPGPSSEAGDGLPGRVSPLLLVTEGRFYTYLTASAPGEPLQAGPPLIRGQEPEAESAYEAAFGRAKVAAAGGGPAAAGGDPVSRMDLDLDPSRPVWQHLFDAPSHVLPAPAALADAFLRLLTTSD